MSKKRDRCPSSWVVLENPPLIIRLQLSALVFPKVKVRLRVAVVGAGGHEIAEMKLHSLSWGALGNQIDA